MKILIIDNYDSFTYNLVHLVESITKQKVDVIRNDQVNVEDITKYDKILLSPGPGVPDEAGKLKEIIKQYGSSKSILGVCLGLQAIAEVFGGKLNNIEEVYHGVATEISVFSKNDLFYRIPDTFLGGRYHSWIVSRENLPDCFDILAEDKKGNIMAIAHKNYNLKGVQFHPESVLTDHGEQIIRNWLFQEECGSINLPSKTSQNYDLNNLSSKLLFC